MEMSPTAAPLDLGHRKILVVDDDRLSLRILAGVLKGEGCTLVKASSGEGALLAYAEFLPDLVLLDVMLPGIDGFETCRRLKRSYGENCAPVIFITGKKESDDVLAGLGAGGGDYLPKPFKAKEVLARIRAHLQNRILSEQRKHLVDQLSNANAAKNRLLGMAAHDLRNPLATIRGLAEFLREGDVGPLSVDQLNLINTIHSVSQSMLNPVNALLDVATIESGELKLCREPHNLADLIAQSVAMTGLEATNGEECVVAYRQTIEQAVELGASHSLRTDTSRDEITTALAATIETGLGTPTPRRHELRPAQRSLAAPSARHRRGQILPAPHPSGTEGRTFREPVCDGTTRSDRKGKTLESEARPPC